MTEDLKARQGDVLVVSYPECKIPLTTKYGNITVGGLIYTRQLNQGDSVQAEYDRVYEFLKRSAERDAREKVKLWTQEMEAAAKRPPPLAPRPAGAVEQRPVATTEPKPQTTGATRPKPTTTGQQR